MKKVAVTGALSCGKSSACRFFRELGSYVISADEIVHRLLSFDTVLSQQVIRLLGDDVVVNGEIDRKIIANKVFDNRTLLLSLEKLLHPAVFHEINEQYQQIIRERRFPLFIAEIPLLFEADLQSNFDLVIDIWSEPLACRQRFKEATGYGEDEYDKRMSRQLPAEEKARRADIVIKNNGSLQDLHTNVARVFNQLVSDV